MSYASRMGRARVSSTSPEAAGVCQRCGIWYSRSALRNQVEWRGVALLPLYIFVCPTCYDTPQEQLRAIVIPADPVPIPFPLVEPFITDETSLMGLNGSTTDPVTGIPIPNTTGLGTTTGVGMVPEPVGRPVGLDANAVMPLALVNGVPTHFDVPVPYLSVMANGTDQITVTCSAAHGLTATSQIAVQGLLKPLACGVFTVVPLSATAFTYQTYSEIASGSLLGGGNVLMVTANVGLPYGWAQVPQVGP